jgi:murein DD-endopeptidase MepM/ murein hydrolase activator NlpD
VDIFARRGTPVVATSEGTVRRVEITNIGGKVVWLRDPVRNSSIYYAHLDSQVVRDGQAVMPGDVVGFVGNTGNARTTPPHLHFGIYRRGEGPIDPAPFVRRPRGTLEDLTADLAQLGSWVRLRNEAPRHA